MMSDPHGEWLIREEFQKRRNRQIGACIPAVGGLILTVLGKLVSDDDLWFSGVTLAFLGLGIIVGVVVFSYINWRCPACDAYLGKSLSPSYCERCGVRLR